MNLKFASIILAVLAWISFALGDDISDAVKRGDLEKIRLLLKNNPDLVSSTNSYYGMTPLHWAVLSNHKEVAELLLANKANVDATDQGCRTPLFLAAFGGGKEMAELLLANKANINATNEHGETLLIRAANLGNERLTEMLLQSNACVDCKDRTLGYSALRCAVNNHHVDVMELLLLYKADVNTRDNHGFTPLCTATWIKEARLLLANKADVNVRDIELGGTALHWASGGSKDVAELLLASNADVNARDNTGNTPLHWAARAGNEAVVELLLASNAVVNAKDNIGNTPLQLAFDNKAIATLLRLHGGHGKENTTKPLVGWYLDGDTDSQHDKAIINDYQAYAQKIWPKDHDFFISEVNFYEDGTGRHAVRIELEPAMRDYKEYFLMYNTNNVRTKVIKGKTWHQFHM